MGGSNWVKSHYDDRVKLRAVKGEETFAYTADVRRGAAPAKVHAALDPGRLKAGRRESRDSDAHPESHAVAVVFDVTGSMQTVPQILQKKLPTLMSLLLTKGYLAHPAILVGAIGDATCDRAPLQLGQFESDIEIETDLTNLYLEGGGGGHITESYELALYFLAHHTATDCWEKRKRKGYCFLIGDEIPYPEVDWRQVKALFGDAGQREDDMSTATILRQAQERWEIYFVIPKLTSHWGDKRVLDPWRELLGQNVLQLEDPEGISELLAGVIGAAEGAVTAADVGTDLAETGASASVCKAVTTALAKSGAAAGSGLARKSLEGTGLAVP